MDILVGVGAGINVTICDGTYLLFHEVSQLLANSVLAPWRQQLGSHHPLYNFLLDLGEFDLEKNLTNFKVYMLARHFIYPKGTFFS